MASLAATWQQRFFGVIQHPETANALRDASLRADMRAWTTALTAAVVEACAQMGWVATAKGHRLELLPVSRSEYLSLDAVAFAEGSGRWRFPTAVMELENKAQDDSIAYSLWKVLCVRAELRAVFCYRPDAEAGAPLVRRLRDEVISGMELQHLAGLHGETLVVVGSRGEAATFPYAFFKWWRLDANTGQFGLL